MSNYRSRFPWFIRYPARFVSGRAMDGVHRTDATFLHEGTRALTVTGRASRWAMLPGWKRAAVRVGTAATVYGEVVAFSAAPGATLALNAAVVTAAASWAGRWSWRRIRRWSLDRNVVTPLWYALSPIYPDGARMEDWLHVPIGYDTDKSAEIYLQFPLTWQGTAEQKRLAKDLVSRKLGGQWDAHWHEIGQSSLTLTHAPQPPSRVTFEEVLPIIRKLAQGRVLLGLGSRNEPIIIDFDAETPHVALSIGTGGGKSSTLCLLAIQLLAQGATIEGIDPKRVSLNPLRGLPGIRIHRDIGAQWDAIAMLKAEMDQRYIQLDRDETMTFDRRVLFLEEQNAFYNDSKYYWEEIKDKGQPRTPPVYRDINDILNKGRQVGVNAVGVFQRMDAAESGGGAARDQYGMKVLARFSPKAWKMLVDTYPRPKSSNHRGRAIVADGGEYKTVQLAIALDTSSKAAKLSPAALNYVLEATQGSTSLGTPGMYYTPAQAPQDGTELSNLTASHSHSASGDLGKDGVNLTPTVRYNLNEAAQAGIVPMKYDALRKARSDDPDFPEGTKINGVQRYTDVELITWYNNRTRTTQRIPLPRESEKENETAD